MAKRICVYLGSAENAKGTYLGCSLFPLKETPRGPKYLPHHLYLNFQKREKISYQKVAAPNLL